MQDITPNRRGRCVRKFACARALEPGGNGALVYYSNLTKSFLCLKLGWLTVITDFLERIALIHESLPQRFINPEGRLNVELQSQDEKVEAARRCS